jgi:Flp pilus assembly pilin Flp
MEVCKIFEAPASIGGKLEGTANLEQTPFRRRSTVTTQTGTKAVKRLRNQRGQAMTEYIIIVCLIACACLMAVGIFGTNIRNLWSAASDSLSQGVAVQAHLNAGPGERDIRINDYID